MVKEASLKFVSAIETGVMDLQAMRGNFDELEDVAKDHANELRALAFKQTQTISYCVDESGLTTILNGGKHTRVKIVNAFVQMGDSVNSEEIVKLVGISDAIKFSDSEKSGKVRVFNILKEHLMFYEDIIVETTNDRRVIVNVTIESEEVGN